MDRGRGPGRGGWGRIAPWRHARIAEACAAHAERLAQGLQMSKDHLLPITGVPETSARGMAGCRDRCCRKAGVEPASRYVTGLIRSSHKTLQGIYAVPVWEHNRPSRRALHEAVVAAGWDSHALLRRHRAPVAHAHQGRGREVIGVAGTLAQHERGPHIFGGDQADDDVQKRTARVPTVVTAVLSNRRVLEGLEVVVQEPKALNEEMAYWEATSKASDEQMEEAWQRGLDRLHHRQHRVEYRKRTERAREIGQQLAEEGPVPQAHDAVDPGVLTLDLTRSLDSRHTHWVSE